MKNDFTRIEKIMAGQSADIVPLYEHLFNGEMLEAVMGYKLEGDQREVLKKRVQFYQQMGYDYMPYETGPRFARLDGLVTKDTAEMAQGGDRGWVDEHNGAIKDWADLENPDFWPEDIYDYNSFDIITELLPEGMKIIGGCSGGPYEHATFSMGFVPMCMKMQDDPAFVEAYFNKIGETLVAIATRVAKLPVIGVYRYGDDMGYKGATMISPEDLRKYVFPWAKKIVAEAHAAGKKFLLHSCGNLEEVMDDLIDDVGIDAKHSWEDVIMPVTEAKARWGKRIAIFGGVDVDFLCRNTPEQVKEYSKRILDVCGNGGYAFGSGNSITNYVPVKNYLAMVEAWREWNGI